ncbi:hypothetical protein [Pseudomonas sp. NPDC089406]|uniref:hypothetical protein n=1 Tax=Pseudomonas sp. NPDC089406 TaxID=3364463 RepID=UPI00384DB5FD
MVSFGKQFAAGSATFKFLTLFFLGFVLLAGVGLFYGGRVSYLTPDLEKLVSHEGRIRGYPDTVKHHADVLIMGVGFEWKGEAVRQRIYAYRELYERSGLRMGSRVRLLVEETPVGILVREVETQDGVVIFNDALNYQVSRWLNEQADRVATLGVMTAAGVFVLAFVLGWRDRRIIFRRT